MNEEEKKTLRRKKSLNVTFDKFKYDIDNFLDDHADISPIKRGP